MGTPSPGRPGAVSGIGDRQGRSLSRRLSFRAEAHGRQGPQGGWLRFSTSSSPLCWARVCPCPLVEDADRTALREPRRGSLVCRMVLRPPSLPRPCGAREPDDQRPNSNVPPVPGTFSPPEVHLCDVRGCQVLLAPSHLPFKFTQALGRGRRGASPSQGPCPPFVRGRTSSQGLSGGRQGPVPSAQVSAPQCPCGRLRPVSP